MLFNFLDVMSQRPSGGPMHSGNMNASQRMMGTSPAQMAGMPMRGSNQVGPRMSQPGMKNS